MSKRKKKSTKRSGFEDKIWESLGANQKTVGYETEKISYTVPEKIRNYIPDFILPNGIYVEVKGRLTLADRQKMVWVKNSNPDLDIRFVFQRKNNYIRKGSKTTYAEWAEKNGFPYAEGTIPDEWLNEKS